MALVSFFPGARWQCYAHDGFPHPVPLHRSIAAVLKDFFMSTSQDTTEPLKTFAPPPFIVSKVKRTHHLWRYLWPFQSIKQALIILFASLLIMFFHTTILHLRPQWTPMLSSRAAFILLLIILGPCTALPAKLTVITQGSAKQFVPQLEKLISEQGYAVSPLNTSKGQIYFCAKWPPYLTWLYSPEQNVELRRVCENEIELRGPARSLNSLHMFLRWELEK